ncbi:MAG: heterocyst frequency control protein PatD [Myxacorys chilensis ATA2-1-KO14]|nr:heterocyst frequency control protein PatD [Myxacorys chilensis ATA2-1-KO14]
MMRMIPEFHQSIYQSFRGVVEQLQMKISQLGQKRDDQENESIDLRPELISLQKIFQEDIRSLNIDALTNTEAHRVRSIWVEIDKQLRLLGMDVAYVRAAKQPETLQQRVEQVKGRLEMLIVYCGALLSEER